MPLSLDGEVALGELPPGDVRAGQRWIEVHQAALLSAFHDVEILSRATGPASRRLLIGSSFGVSVWTTVA